jgi:hypothetical protein
MSVDQDFEIIDGVRRSKAALMAGQAMISARIENKSGTLGPIFQVNLDRLHSPHKDRIDVSTPRALQRWMNILKGVHGGSTFPPIIVRPGSRGPRIQDVDFEY